MKKNARHEAVMLLFGLMLHFHWR